MPKHVTDDIDAVVISTAIPETNPELARARELGIAVWHRAHMLAELGRGKKTLAASGTHGKTTTSSMLATATDALGLEPTFVVGGIVDAYHTNAVSGKGDYYVVEADESDGSFLNLSPYVALVTNVEADIWITTRAASKKFARRFCSSCNRCLRKVPLLCAARTPSS